MGATSNLSTSVGAALYGQLLQDTMQDTMPIDLAELPATGDVAYITATAVQLVSTKVSTAFLAEHTAARLRALPLLPGEHRHPLPYRPVRGGRRRVHPVPLDGGRPDREPVRRGADAVRAPRGVPPQAAVQHADTPRDHLRRARQQRRPQGICSFLKRSLQKISGIH